MNIDITYNGTTTTHDLDLSSGFPIRTRGVYCLDDITIKRAARLPNEYQEVSYLESSGSQYISTDFIASTDTVVKISGFVLLASTQRYGVFLGSTSADNASDSFLFRRLATNNAVDYQRNSQGSAFARIDISVSVSYPVSLGRYLFVVGQDYVAASPVADGVYPFNLFAGNLGGSAWRHSYCRLGEIEMYQHSNQITPTYNFVPCYRKSDNKPGMYELINHVFYTNQGTGEFVVGADV